MMAIQNQYTTEENLIKAVQCLSLAAGGNAKYCFMAAVRKKEATFQKILFKAPGVQLSQLSVSQISFGCSVQSQ